MQLSHGINDLLGSMALMALLAFAYSVIFRALPRRSAPAILGALFGCVAIWAMLNPISVAEGVIVDLRSVPVILAGAFLGWPGALVTAAMAAMMRIWTGGVGAPVGVIGIVVGSGVGLIWAAVYRRRQTRPWIKLPALALSSALCVLTTLLLPWDIAVRLVTGVWPFLIPLQAFSVLVVATLLDRERSILREHTDLGEAATRDPLTGLLNRRGFEQAVTRLPVGPRGRALLVLDLDHFKRVNDTHGHAAGDAVLRSLGTRLRDVLRRGDLVARFGGEEMVVLLPDVDLEDAQGAAARICEAVRSRPFSVPGGVLLSVTASVGGSWAKEWIVPDSHLAHADAELYAVKIAGRNGWRVAVSEQADAKSHGPGTLSDEALTGLPV